MPINNHQKKLLRNIGHTLKPVVTVAGNGLTERVLQEIRRALSDHELIKIKLAIIDRQQRSELINDICHLTRAEAVQSIGKTTLLYLPAATPNIKLSNVHIYRSALL